MAIYLQNDFGADVRTDDLVAHSKKIQPAYLVGNMRQAILTLVRKSDPELEKSLRMKNGERDPRELKIFTDNYGVGTPHKVPFVSLFERHIKALVGYFMELPFPLTVTATDSRSVWLAREEMAQNAMRQVNQLVNQLISGWATDEEQQQHGSLMDKALQDVAKSNETFQSKLERFCSVLLDSLIERLGLRDKLAQFVDDLCSTGRLHYRCWLEEVGQIPRFEVIPPGELHFSRDKSLGDIQGHRWVVRKRMVPRSDVLTQYGHMMSREEREIVMGRRLEGSGTLDWHPLRAGQEVGNYFDMIAIRNYGLRAEDAGQLIPVYHVEWRSASVDAPEDEFDQQDNSSHDEGQLSTLEHNGRQLKGRRPKQFRYEGICIDDRIFLAMGRSRFPTRPEGDPYGCYLSYNGMIYGKSLYVAGIDLQRKYDLLSFHQDNLIAIGGVPGVMIDINDIPTYLGAKMPERVAAWRANLKNGMALVNRNQAGTRTQGGSAGAQNNSFNNSGSIDTSFNGQSIDAIRNEKIYVEELASRISGVPRQMLSEISERDGLGTTRQAIVAATKVNRPMFSTVLRFSKAAMTDLINLCRVTAKYNPEAISGILGSAAARLIAVGAERFPIAQLSVILKDAIEEKDSLERLRQAGQLLIEQMAVEPKMVLDIATLNNVAMLRHALEQNVNQQAGQQNQQMQQQLEQVSGELQKAQAQLDKINEADAQLKAQDVQNKLMLGQETIAQKDRVLAQKAEADQKQDEVENRRVDLEEQQMVFNESTMEPANA